MNDEREYEFWQKEALHRRTNEAANPLEQRGRSRQLKGRVLVEVRCLKKGHLLACVYETPEGALFYSTASHAQPGTRISRRSWTPTRDLIDVLPEHPSAHPALHVNCRCGKHDPIDRGRLMLDVHKARDTKRKVKFVAE